MSVRLYPDVGKVWFPEASLSLPGHSTRRKPVNLVVASLRRPEWSIRGFLKRPDLAVLLHDLDPLLLRTKVVWTSITHNERVNMGGELTATLLFGAVAGATTALGLCVAMGVGNANFAVTTTDLSIGTINANMTTNEFTVAGLGRTAATVQNFVAQVALNGTMSVDCYKSFAVVAPGGTAWGAALFDQVVVAGSHLLQEDKFVASAVCVAGDILQITYTTTT